MLGLRLDPSLKKICNSFTKGFFFFEKKKKDGEYKKISIEASAIEFLKGSYQSVSPKTLKEGG